MHQAVEKALKAAKFYQNGKPNLGTTDLVSLVTDLFSCEKSDTLMTTVSQLIRLGVDFDRPRNPDSTRHSTSMQVYADFHSDEALVLCKGILDIVREVIDILDL